MAKDPAFLFYPNDYIGGTMGMTFEEKGAYVDLLMLQFNRGHMTSHMIGQVIGRLEVNSQAEILTKFKKDADDLYYNERLEIEIKNRKKYILSRSNNLSGMNQYSKKTGRTTSSTTSVTRGRAEDVDEDVNESTNVDSSAKNENDKNPELNRKRDGLITPELFDDFWEFYPRKDVKGKAKTSWDKLCKKGKDRPTWIEIKKALRSQIESEQWQTKKFIPMPATWINQNRWLDDPKLMIAFKKEEPKPNNRHREKDKEYKVDGNL
jgi:uncharacterized protein YdaU (DUF1376 family)